MVDGTEESAFIIRVVHIIIIGNWVGPHNSGWTITHVFEEQERNMERLVLFGAI